MVILELIHARGPDSFRLGGNVFIRSKTNAGEFDLGRPSRSLGDS